MNGEKLDLSLLDPTNEAGDWERLVDRITKGAAPELARRRERLAGPVILLAGWIRPALKAAAVIAVVSSATLMSAERTARVVQEQQAAVADEIQMPMSEWFADESPPTVSELILAFDGEILQ